MEAAATTATTGEVEEAATTASRPRPVTPAILERTLVRRLGARVKGCADEAGAWIRAVPVRVEVAANGRVVSAAFHEELSPRFRGCLERLIVGRTLPAPGQRTSLSLTLRW